MDLHLSFLLAALALTPEQYAVCQQDLADMRGRHEQLAAQSARLEADYRAMNGSEGVLEARQAELAQLREALSRQREAIGKEAGKNEVSPLELDQALKAESQFREARAHFNEKLAAYNNGVRAQTLRREAYNHAATTQNAGLADYATRAAEVDARCAGR